MSQAHAESKPIDRYIPWMFVAFFAVIALVDAAFVTVAIQTRPGIVTAQAYEKGIAYNDTLNAAKAMEALGWQSSITYANGVLAFTLTDKNKKPIKDAIVRAEIRRPVTDAHDIDVTLVENTQGQYTAKVAMPLAGQWLVRVYTLADGQEYQSTTTLTLP